MALILSRMAAIERQITNCEDLYAMSHNESEKKNLQKEMSRLTTEYIRLSAKLG